MSVYLKLIWAYLKIGLFGFGGGYAMLALIEREVVTPGWITEQMFTDIVAISQMTPGPIGINSATYIGYVVTGSVLGSIVTTVTVMLPSFLLVLYASHNFTYDYGCQSDNNGTSSHINIRKALELSKQSTGNCNDSV